MGMGRCFLAVLSDAYQVEEVNGSERVVLKLKPELAPVKAAVFPLLKNKPELVAKAREIYAELSRKMMTEFDDNGNIGKRYRRQDEIGTPSCVVVDFDTLDAESLNFGTVAVRDRDTTEQVRVKIEELTDFLNSKTA
jgi:glycyl-tRNA synthetase